MEKGSLQKHSSSSRKLGRQEGDGALGAASGSLGLAPRKSKLKDKLSAIRQDRAERRESLQKQDAIHEVDSSEDETDEGSEDSQDGRKGTTFAPPPLLKPTTVRTGPGGTLPSLCLSPSTSHATFSHAGPSQLGRPGPSHALPSLTETQPGQGAALKETRPAEDGAGPERGVHTKPSQGPLPFSTPGSAFISVSKDTFLKPTPPKESRSLSGKAATSEPRSEDQIQESPRTTVPIAPLTTNTPDRAADPRSTTSTTDCRTSGSPEAARTSCSSPGIPKEKKEADNRRLCAAAAAAAGLTASSSSPSGSRSSSCSPVLAPESGMDKVVSQLASVAKSVLGPVKLVPAADKSQKDQKPSRGGTPEVPPTDPLPSKPRQSPHVSESQTRQKPEQVASPTASQRSTKPSAQRDRAAPQPPSCKDARERPTSGSAASTSGQRQNPPPPAAASSPTSSAASESKRKRSDPQTTSAATSSPQDKAGGKKT